MNMNAPLRAWKFKAEDWIIAEILSITVSDARELAEKVGFDSRSDREDAEHWEQLQAFIDQCFAHGSTIKTTDHEYITHMLKAFARGERFLVAKLSYAGGRA